MVEYQAYKSNIHYFSQRLQRKLEGILSEPATVIEAPSGYGKTTAVKDFLEQNLNKSTRLFWWNAVEDSSEGSWTRLCLEIEKIDPAAGKQMLDAGFPRIMSAWEIGRIIENIRCDIPTVMVLDDFHFLQKELPRTVVLSILSHVSSNLHIVIITQTARPFQFSFFEQSGVYYLRAEDLRLSTEDIIGYFKLCGATVAKEEAVQIYSYTEGWIVALYLTVLQMRRGEGISPGLSLLQLMESIVWENLSKQEKKLFLYIAPFSGVTIEQICFLLKEEQLPESIFSLLDETPFIRYETDERRYVPHSILREMLIRRLTAADIKTRTECYGRAGQWYAGNGKVLDALSCFFKVEDYESVLSLPLINLTMTQVNGIPFVQLAAEFLSKCSDKVKFKYPVSLLRIAYAFIGADMHEQAEALLVEVKSIILHIDDKKEQKALMGEWTLIYAYLFFPDIIRMESIIQDAAAMINGKCRTLTAGEPFAFGLPLMIFFHKTAGSLEKEIQALSNIMNIFSNIVNIKNGADELMKAEAALYQGCFAEAEILAFKAEYIAEAGNYWSLRMGTVNLMAQLAYKRGSNTDLSKCMKILEEAEGSDNLNNIVSQLLQTDYYMWSGLLQLIPKWLLEKNGDISCAPSWIRIYLKYYMMGILLLEEEYLKLIGVAETVIDECKKQGYLMVEIYMHLIAALGHFKTGRIEEAFKHVKEALEKSVPDKLYLPFMEFKSMLGNLTGKAFDSIGEPMPEEIISGGHEIGDNWKLMIRLISESGTYPHGLTEREMEVATLAAKGMSNKEIAAKLFISETTVKFHMRSVFSKLDIDKRSKLAGIL